MSKVHIINLSITNDSGYDMSYLSDWFDSGRVADGYAWPASIKDGYTAIIQCYEKDWSLAGCSGYVMYKISDTPIAIGFSNPVVGYNKVGFGSDGKQTWNSMGNHDYLPFSESTSFFTAFESCTGSSVNNAILRITPFANFPESTKDHIINLAIFNYSGYDLIYDKDWFDSGRLGDNQNWPSIIRKGGIATIQCYEKDFALTGCSGYVSFKTNGGPAIAIAFSNPLVGVNKLGVGTDGETTWNNMDNHGYQPFTQDISGKLIALCSCTGSKTNFALACLSISVKSWMSNITDSKPLNALSIPGTHDSCATFFYGTFSKCQYFGIQDQMNLGIRFLDIRCDIADGKLYIYHGPVYQFISFEDVLNQVKAFLDANPTETIILSVKNEGKSPDSVFYPIFYNSYFMNPAYNSYFFAQNRMPVMNEIRKKIVLIRRFGTGNAGSPVGIDASSGWIDNSALFTLNNGVPMTIQDLYNPNVYTEKETAIQNLFDTQSSYGSSLLINFSSGYEGLPSPNGPENFANKINPWMNKFLLGRPVQRLGIVAMDFPIYDTTLILNYTLALIPTIIKANV